MTFLNRAIYLLYVNLFLVFPSLSAYIVSDGIFQITDAMTSIQLGFSKKHIHCIVSTEKLRTGGHFRHKVQTSNHSSNVHLCLCYFDLIGLMWIRRSEKGISLVKFGLLSLVAWLTHDLGMSEIYWSILPKYWRWNIWLLLPKKGKWNVR